MKHRNLYLIMVVAIFTFGCAAEGKITDAEVLEGSGDYGMAVLPIYGGSAPNAPEHEAVVALHQLDKKGTSVYVSPFCSGTLIASDVVVTAAHCLDTARRGSNFRTMAPNRLAIYVGDEPAVDILDHLYMVSETLIKSNYDRLELRNDIALVRLGGPITEAVTPVANLPAAQGFTSADVGDDLNFAGFGQTEYGTSGVKLQVDVPLGSLGCYVAGCPDGADIATQIAYAQPQAGPCFGDSGGPAFVYRNLIPYVGGITSYGDSNCLVYGVSTRVDAFESWINDFVGVAPDCSADGWCNPDCAAGEDPDCYTPPDCSADGTCNPDCAAGEDPDCTTPPDCSADGTCNPDCAAGEDPDCGTPSECGDGICDEGESCDGRYDTISCRDDCPGKTKGKKKRQYCYVGGTCEGQGCP